MKAIYRTAIIAAVAAGLLLAGSAPHAASAERLKYVLILTRHGVRSPTWTSDRLNPYSSEPWPEWGVEPGELTPHGHAAMTIFGVYYRAWLSNEHLLASSGCEDSRQISIWADVDERTIETGHALAEGLLPGCELPVGSAHDNSVDPLFDPIAGGLAVPDPARAVEAVQASIGAAPQTLFDSHRAEFGALALVLADGKPVEKKVDDGGPIAVVPGAAGAELRGPFSTASTLTENLLLEYTNGFEGKTLAWGRLDRDTLDRVLVLHGIYADLMRRTGYPARVRGSNLVAHILQSLRQAATGTPVDGAIGRPHTAVLVLSGHDTNLSNVSGMLGLTWHLAGYQENDTPPGGALVFSLWQDEASHAYRVRTTYMAQSLDAIRNLTPLTLAAPPGREDVHVPGCPAEAAAGCDWPVFDAAVEAKIDQRFTSVRAIQAR